MPNNEPIQDDPFLDQIRADWMKPHEYVLIQGEMSTEDNIAIQNKLAKMRPGQGRDQEIVMQLGDVMLLTLQRLVKGWNLTRTAQRGAEKIEVPIPYSAEMIKKLPKRYTDYMYAEINKRNQDPSEEEQKDFLPSVVDASNGSWDEERAFHLK